MPLYRTDDDRAGRLPRSHDDYSTDLGEWTGSATSSLLVRGGRPRFPAVAVHDCGGRRLRVAEVHVLPAEFAWSATGLPGTPRASSESAMARAVGYRRPAEREHRYGLESTDRDTGPGGSTDRSHFIRSCVIRSHRGVAFIVLGRVSSPRTDSESKIVTHDRIRGTPDRDGPTMGERGDFARFHRSKLARPLYPHRPYEINNRSGCHSRVGDHEGCLRSRASSCCWGSWSSPRA
jgi:hypothetical protein